MSTFGRGPEISVIVVCYNMAREAPRTLHSLSAAYQRHVAPDNVEIIVVDNGSDVPLDARATAALSGTFRHIRLEPGRPSPAHAINRGLEAARGGVVGVMIDGARIATPGLLHAARHGARLYDNAVVATLGWYLGYDLQGWSTSAGYDQLREDGLLVSIGWPGDGYRLFEIGTMDESSVDGWFQPVTESNAIFARREMWAALGGVDERFDLPGGGLLNLDTYARLLDVPGAELVIPLGEATFHQVHGGFNTNAPPQRQATNFAHWAAQYAAIRGRPWQPAPRGKPPTYVGTLPPAVLGRFVRSALRPAKPGWTSPLGDDFREDLWTGETASPSGAEPIARLVELGRAAFRAGRLEASCAVARLVAERAPDEPGLAHVLSLVSSALSTGGPPAERGADYHLALGDAHAILGETETAATHYRLALTFTADLPQAHLALARFRMPGEDYLRWLERFYAELEPASIIEVGVFQGASLALARPPTIAIGVDPEARMLTPPQTETHVFAETSDAFFERGRARTLLADRPLSIGFIDGLHLFEQALRDFIGLEALCGPGSLILVHDTVPLDEPTQTRERRTTFHTGDVWKLVLALKQYRPDLDVFTIACGPSGLTVVQGLDPASSVLASTYDEIVARFMEVQFSSIADDLSAHLNLVPNRWDQVRARLRGAQRSSSRSERNMADIVGTHVVDRDQPPLTPEQAEVVRQFHELYYARWRTGGGDTINTSWLGHQTLKCPLDVWLYQELLVRRRPDVVVETGTFRGGSALYLATVLDQLGHGRVITIDAVPQENRPEHPRITYVTGSSTDPAIVAAVREMVGDARAMVVLDSDHTEAHVYGELLAYQSLVRPGDYLIVEDTNVNGHPAYPEFGPGPMEAVTRFLSEHDEFVYDDRCARFLMTLNPGGYLRRKTSS